MLLGVPALTKTAFQEVTSKPDKPFSIAVGTLGKLLSLWLDATAKALILFDWIEVYTGPKKSNATSISPLFNADRTEAVEL